MLYFIFLDIETTGLDPQKHKAIDIACSITDPELKAPCVTYESLIKRPLETFEEANPISLSINGLTHEMVQQGKTIEEVSKDIVSLFSGLGIHRNNAVFLCQNPSFDRGFFSQIVPISLQEKLLWPYHWLDLASMFWITNSKELSKRSEFQLSKDSIASFYKLLPEKKPHRAMNGVAHLMLCYEALLQAGA